jgi:hypothetical protein
VAKYFVVLAMVVPALAIIIRAGAEFNGLFLIYAPICAAIWIWARRRRLEGWGESVLLYDEVPGDMPNLGIRELTWGRLPQHKESS